MKKVIAITLLGIFVMSLAIVAAQSDDSEYRNRTETEARLGEGAIEVNSGSALSNKIRINTSAIRERLGANEEITLTNSKLRLRKINAEILELKGEKGEIVRTRLELQENETGNLKAKLSNGRNAEIKIMPDTASERAIERLRLKVCNETRNNCTIELKEVGQGNQTRLAYEAKVKKRFRLFGLFKSDKEVTTQIDAETGEEILTKKPWWSWMASEKEIE